MSTVDEIVEEFSKINPYINFLYEGDVSIAITDQDKFIYTNYSDGLDLKAKAGDPIPKGGAIREALNSKKEV